MRKVFLMLVLTLAIGLMSFNQTETKDSNLVSSNDVTMSMQDPGDVICTRSCFYQGGELIGCTEWDCDGGSLDEIIIYA